MRQDERLAAILDELAANRTVGAVDLATRLGVSAATIRRDLELLQEQRLLTRTHGGAVAQGVLYELPLRYKSARRQDEKRRIATEAASRIEDGLAVGLTGGTTCTEVARGLVERQAVTIVTNALNIASELAVRPNLRLLVTGGTARPESYELVGPIAEAMLEGLTLDVALIGVDGIDAEHGCTTHHEVEAHTNATLIARARQVIVVADSTKVGASAFARICPIDRVDELITDRAANVRALKALRDAGVTVSVV